MNTSIIVIIEAIQEIFKFIKENNLNETEKELLLLLINNN